MSDDQQERPETMGDVMLNVLLFAAQLGYRQLTCPVCGGPPLPEAWMFSGGAQAMCKNSACPAMTWDPRRTAREALVEMHYLSEEIDDQGRTTWR